MEASLDLVAVHPDGTRIPVAFRVGTPERAPTGEWRCAVRLDGLYDGLAPAHGEDGVQALCLALGLAARLLRAFVARGGRLVHSTDIAESDAGSDEEWPLEAYFGWLGELHPPAG